jgi:hypothetical protein
LDALREMIGALVQILMVLSATIFAGIALHRALYYHGIINFEFNRVDRIKRLFDISFVVHMVSVLAFLIINILK